MKRVITLVAASAVALAFTAPAPVTRLVVVLTARSVSQGLIPEGITDSFGPDAPAIHSIAVFADAAQGTKVRGSWVAVDAIATPNFEIDATEVSLVAGEARAHFQLSRPNNGWPVGHYKLDLSVDGVFVTAVPFTIEEQAGGGAGDWAAGATAKPRESAPAKPRNSAPAKPRSSAPVASPTPAASVAGSWQCQISMNGTPVGEGVMTFGADGTADIGGNQFRWQIVPGQILRLQDGTGFNDYSYELAGERLTMRYTDGSAFACVRTTGLPQGAAPNYGGGAQANQGYGANPQQGAGQADANSRQLRGTFCHWGGSSNYSSGSSYSHTERITFDGRGHWAFGSEASFSSGAGNYANGGGTDDSGTYRIRGNQIQYQTGAGEVGVAQVKMQGNDGSITEILVDGELYSPSLCG